MREKKGCSRMSFYKTQELTETFNLIRSDLKYLETFKILH